MIKKILIVNKIDNFQQFSNMNRFNVNLEIHLLVDPLLKTLVQKIIHLFNK
jgi:hypothetical protein